MNSPTSLSVAARFALIMDGLGKAVAARIGHYPITAPMIVYIWKRLNGINQRFQALAARILAGKFLAERRRQPRASARPTTEMMPGDADASAAARPFAVWRLLPLRRFGWLCWVAPSVPGSLGAAAFGDGLRSLLAEPEMAALLAATPRMGQLLRPLCWALGVEPTFPQPRRIRADTAVIAETLGADAGAARDGAVRDGAATVSSPPPTDTPAWTSGAADPHIRFSSRRKSSGTNTSILLHFCN